ncbi:unnamed protein product [Stenotrophomonas maltophilia]|uniref:hypothetical protein n=1 Tax=Stenotrophomonas maltophilia TaxID=40324 RepID=UPI0006A8422C|nr:hypothetical protein [Stenotrophomonas maltophilia]CRX68579.1 unnamed protein product [Stenotrophomonas maltophilia]
MSRLHTLPLLMTLLLLPALPALAQSAAPAPAARPAPATPLWRWWLASACSLVVALGVGLQFSGHSPLSPAVPAPVLASMEDNSVLYDENPDLYLWLGDTDLAME